MCVCACAHAIVCIQLFGIMELWFSVASQVRNTATMSHDLGERTTFHLPFLSIQCFGNNVRRPAFTVAKQVNVHLFLGILKHFVYIGVALFVLIFF